MSIGNDLSDPIDAEWLEAQEASGLSAFAWPTSDRPETLGRGLSAWCKVLEDAEDGAFSSAPPDIVVADDSRRESQSTRAVVSELAPKFKGKVFLLDRPFRADLSSRLDAVSDGAAGFGFGFSANPGGDCPSYGSARNLIHLALAGRTFAMTDDDVLPEIRIARDATNDVLENTLADPTVSRPYCSEEELDSVSYRAGFPMGLYERFLGARYEGNRVAALCFGSWGDSGLPSARYLVSGRPGVDGGIYDAKETYDAAIDGRLAFRASPVHALGGSFLMGIHLALDARSILPPFSPLGRGEDGLWGSSLRILNPGQVIAYPPFALRHAPAEARSSGRDEALLFEIRLNDMLNLIILEGHIREDGLGEAHNALGADLLDLSRRSGSGLGDALAAIRGRAASSFIAVLETSLEANNNEPVFWARDVEVLLSAARDAASAADPSPPSGLPGGMASFAAYLAGFGRLLQAWPTIWQAALDLGPEFLERARIKS